MDSELIQTECMKTDDDIRWLVALISDTGMRLAEAAGFKNWWFGTWWWDASCHYATTQT